MSQDNWSTPPEFMAWIRRYWTPDLDVCADETNHQCGKWIGEQENGLVAMWADLDGPRTVWCNPPYSKPRPWFDKALAESEDEVMTLLLTNASTGCKWWAELAPQFAEVYLLWPRIQFVAPPGVKRSTNMKDQTLTIITPESVRMRRGPRIQVVNWKDHQFV